MAGDSNGGSVQRVFLRGRRRAARLLGREGDAGGASAAVTGSAAGVGTFCQAPSTSLYLDQMGDVRACCQNAEYPLGNIAERGLREIWDGDRTASLRDALARTDLSLGCQFCRWQMEEDNEALAYARTFDHLAIADSGPLWPQQMELSLSNACNLQCVMCNGDWSSSIRTHREGRAPLPTVYDDAFFDELAEFLPHLRIVKFLGGEPFLGKETLRVMDMLVEAGLTPEVHVTTNGTQWTPRVERIMESLPMHLILSLDGSDATTYESIRVGSDFGVVIENLDRFQDYARRHGTEVNLAHCLMTTNWRQFADFLRFADARDLPVGVNTVTSPVELSLHHLHPDRLDAVVEELDRIDDETRASLGRNRNVWIDQIERLHHRQRALAEFSDVSYYLGRTILGVPWRRRPDGRDHQSEAQQLIRGLANREIGPVLVVDDEEIVVAVEPADAPELVDVDLSALVGRHAAELFSVFNTLHGEGVPEVLSNDDDLQHWRIVFDGESALVVDAVMAPLVDHAGVASQVRIHLAAHRPVRPVGTGLGSGDGEPPTAPQPDPDLHDWFSSHVAPARVHELLIDGDGIVVDIGPSRTDVVGVDLSHLVGGSIVEVIDAFAPVLGALGERAEQELPVGAPMSARLERVAFQPEAGSQQQLLVAMQATTLDSRPGMRVLLALAN